MSGLKDRLATEFKTAMLARDGFLSETLGGLKAVILNQEIASGKRNTGLTDAEIESLFAKELKKREEAAVLYEQGGNQEKADKERREKVVIAAFLPKQLSEAEVEVLVDNAIAETTAESAKDMGKVIAGVKAKAGSSADGALIAKLAKAKLQ